MPITDKKSFWAFTGLSGLFVLLSFGDLCYDVVTEGFVLSELLEFSLAFTVIVILSLLWWKLWVMYAREKETVALMQNNLKRFRSRHTASLESMRAAIEEQFNDWKLSKAESSVARQLILGYSFQRIASANGKSVKTIQNHATSIYNKAMVNGRSDLAAFFLCDLFED